MQNLDDLMPAKDAAMFLGISLRTLNCYSKDHRHRKKLVRYRVSSKVVFYSRESLEKFMDACKQQ